MKKTSPFLSQSAAAEASLPDRPHVRIMLFIVAVHVVIFVVLLMIGCRPEQPLSEDSGAGTSAVSASASSWSSDPTGTEPAEPAADPGRADGYYDRASDLPDTVEVTSDPSLDRMISDTSAGLRSGPPAGGTSSASARVVPGLDDLTRPGQGSGAVPAAGTGRADVVSAAGTATGTPSTGRAEASGPRTYTIRKGDTLYGIARSQGLTLDELRGANPSINPRTMRPGQVVNLPAERASETTAPRPRAVASTSADGPVHTVSRGESLYQIARRYGTSIADLKAANDLSSDRIFPGQELTVPDGGSDSSL